MGSDGALFLEPSGKDDVYGDGRDIYGGSAMRKSIVIISAGVLVMVSALAALSHPRLLQSEDLGRTGFLGVYIDEVTPQKAKELSLPGEYGVIVSRVEPGSPADRAGLKENDVIIEFNGIRVEGTLQLNRLVRETPPGRTVSLRIIRDGKRQEIKATIGSRESALRDFPFRIEGPDFSVTLPEIHVPRVELRVSSFSRLGMSVQSLTRQLGEYFGVPGGQGVLITSVQPDSPADRAGLKAGDVITAVEGKEVTSPYTLTRELAQRDGDISLTIIRNKQQQSVTVHLERRPSTRRRSAATEEDSVECFYLLEWQTQRAWQQVEMALAEQMRQSWQQWMDQYRRHLDHMRDLIQRYTHERLRDQMQPEGKPISPPRPGNPMPRLPTVKVL